MTGKNIDITALNAALDASQPAPVRPTECASDGCGNAAAVHFIRGDIGSHYCMGCYLQVQKQTSPALAASQPAPDCHQPDLVTAGGGQPVARLVEAAQWARNRLEKIADDCWHGDARDFKRALIGVFADFDEALANCGSSIPPEIRTVTPALEVQPLTVQDAARVPEIEALIEGVAGLKRIVEEIDGAMLHGDWRDKNGNRLKDTPEWVALYNAMTSLRAIAEGK